eukprot:10470125-Alexandrium_andersonii.AAC.1
MQALSVHRGRGLPPWAGRAPEAACHQAGQGRAGPPPVVRARHRGAAAAGSTQRQGAPHCPVAASEVGSP